MTAANKDSVAKTLTSLATNGVDYSAGYDLNQLRRQLGSKGVPINPAAQPSFKKPFVHRKIAETIDLASAHPDIDRLLRALSRNCSLNEAIVEDATLSWFAELGYAVDQALHLAPDELTMSGGIFKDVVLEGRLSDAIARLNQEVPSEARDDALRKVQRHDAPSLIAIIVHFIRCCATVFQLSIAGTMAASRATTSG